MGGPGMGPTAVPPIHLANAAPPRPRVAERLDDHRFIEDVRPAVRLELTADRSGPQGILDGAWWPRSRDLLEELPSLVAEIRRRGGQISRVSYYPDTWEPAPRTVTVDGGIIKLGWFRSMDPHVLTLTGVYGAGRLDLLVVPPDSLAAPADRLMAAANEPGNRKSASAVLSAGSFVSPMPDQSPA
jgi:hypothetical protein